MKKLCLLLLLLKFTNSYSQSQVDIFCSGRTYKLSIEKVKDNKSTLKIIGFNSQKIVVDSTKTNWDELSQTAKDSLTIIKLKSKGISISNSAVLDNSKFDDASKSTTIDFIDTVAYNDLTEFRTSNLANELTESFKKRFPVTDCKFDFNLLLEMLELKNKSVAKTESLKSITEVFENSFGFGIGLGPNWNRQTVYDYYVSPYDTTLRRDALNSPGFVASLLVTWNKLYTYRKFQDGDTTTATGEKFRAPGWWGVAVGFNFAEVNSSNLQFNFRLSGGIGLLANLGGGFQVGLFHDWTLQKVLRKDLESYLGKKYPFGDYSNLDQRLFTNQFIPSISLKCIYKFKGSNAERKGLFNNDGKQ